MFNVRNSIFSFVNGRKGTNLSANYYKVNGIILYVGGRKTRFKSQTKRCQYFLYSTMRWQYFSNPKLSVVSILYTQLCVGSTLHIQLSVVCILVLHI